MDKKLNNLKNDKNTNEKLLNRISLYLILIVVLLFSTNDTALVAAITLCQRFGPTDPTLTDSQADFIIDSSKKLNEFLIENNVGVEYKFIPNKDHSWSTWAQEVFEVIEYLKNIKFIKGE